MKIKIFGERNTGTNAVQKVLQNNSNSFLYPGVMSEISPDEAKNISDLQKKGITAEYREQLIDKVFFNRPPLERWKHSATNFSIKEFDQVHLIFTVRSPISWLIGLYRRPHHILVKKPDNLISFSELDWRVVGRENVKKNYYKPLELYAEKLTSYLDLINQLERSRLSYSVIKLESFVADQQKVFDMLRQYLVEPRVHFRELIESTKDSSKNSKFYSFYYKNEIWKKEFPEFESIKNPISNEVASFFGYG